MEFPVACTFEGAWLQYVAELYCRRNRLKKIRLLPPATKPLSPDSPVVQVSEASETCTSAPTASALMTVSAAKAPMTAAPVSLVLAVAAASAALAPFPREVL